jgi:hypothetical protein
MPLVCKTHGNAIFVKCPQLLDEPIVQFLRPFSGEKGDNLRPPVFLSVGVTWNRASAMLLNQNVRKYVHPVSSS